MRGRCVIDVCRFQQDGGHWIGKNYTFDKRFSHGADNAETISQCVNCGDLWDRYQAQAKCANKKCQIEVLLCRPCQRQEGGPPAKAALFCALCKPGGNKATRVDKPPSAYELAAS